MSEPLTKNQIVSNLFIGKNFNDCIGRMEPAHLRDDLKMEVIAVVLEWPEERIIRYHNAKALEFFVVRVILNQIQSSTSPFYKKYRQFKLPFDSVSQRLADYFKEDGTGGMADDLYTKSDIQFMANHELRLNDSDGEDSESRQSREELEDFTIDQINHLPFYECEMVKLYMEAGSYRAMQAATQIPYPSCFKAVQKALSKLKKMAEIKKAEQIFTKEELLFIQNGKNENI